MADFAADDLSPHGTAELVRTLIRYQNAVPRCVPRLQILWEYRTNKNKQIKVLHENGKNDMSIT